MSKEPQENLEDLANMNLEGLHLEEMEELNLEGLHLEESTSLYTQDEEYWEGKVL